jgi:hypothetical protein
MPAAGVGMPPACILPAIPAQAVGNRLPDPFAALRTGPMVLVHPDPTRCCQLDSYYLSDEILLDSYYLSDEVLFV